MIDVPNTATNDVLSFVRRNELDKVFAVFHFSADDRTVTFGQTLQPDPAAAGALLPGGRQPAGGSPATTTCRKRNGPP